MTEPTLKPCPFCGGKPRFYHPMDDQGCFAIMCEDCEAETVWSELRDSVATAWNRRAEPQE